MVDHENRCTTGKIRRLNICACDQCSLEADYSSFGLPPSFSGRSHGAAGDNRHCEPDHPSPGSSTIPSGDLFDSAWSGPHAVYLDVQLKSEHQGLCMSVQAHGDNMLPSPKTPPFAC
jgi:hypothetical protein